MARLDNYSKRGKGAVSKKSKTAIEKVGRDEMVRALERYKSEVESVGLSHRGLKLAPLPHQPCRGLVFGLVAIQILGEAVGGLGLLLRGQVGVDVEGDLRGGMAELLASFSYILVQL